ncbi:MAG: T9SS type A sorting domain-containing protein [Bacteroidales bacterium]|nr:T9SS type A sorting domain-containing protein [Bacteroidales bacterium]
MTRKTYLLSILLLLSQYAISQAYVPGNSYFGRADYIEYVAGNLPLIISVPHGGGLTPAEIPDRTCGDESVTDLYTIELAQSIRAEIMEITGCTPHMVICHLKRTKLDANRNVDIAACGNEFAETAWNEYHLFLDSAKVSVKRLSGKGLLIDLHGHGHSIQRLELGYQLSADQLRYPDAMLNEPEIINLSSIRNLALYNITNLMHSELLRGFYSLGTLFASRGYPAVPGIDEPYPLSGEPYFSGGYISERHGSLLTGTVDAIQVECNQEVRFEKTARNAFGTAFAGILLDHLIRHYFPGLPDTYCTSSGSGLQYNREYGIYPVPFGDHLTVRALMPCQLSIYDNSGRIVVARSVEDNEVINTGNLINGTYVAVFRISGKPVYRCKMTKGSTPGR